MVKLVPVSIEHHADKTWRRYESYLFARNQGAVPLVQSELPQATMSLPIAFLQGKDGFAPVAVTGLTPNKNLFVAQDGRWLSRYTPAALRAYPFTLALANAQEFVLCVDEDSGLINANGRGEPFFDQQGQPTETIQRVVGFLKEFEDNRLLSRTACEFLRTNNLLTRLEIQVHASDGVASVEGLYRVDEAAFHATSDTNILQMRANGALLMAYCQMLSMQHLQFLGTLADGHSRNQQEAAAEMSFIPSGDMLNFSN